MTAKPFDLEKDAIFGGISGLTLPTDSYNLSPGMTVSKAYAHVIAPFLVAFSRPSKPSAPHPAPWSSLSGGGLDVTVEISLDEGVRPSNFDRLNTVWFAMSLFRVKVGARLQMPFIANMPINSISKNIDFAHLVPVELRMFQHLTGPERETSEADLDWISEHFDQAADLMDAPQFNRAYQALDRGVWSADTGAGIVIAWAAIETLVRPGDHNITDRVSKAVATLLHGPGPSRDRAFADIRDNYRARGGSAHASTLPERDEFQTAFALARSSILKVIERGRVPSIDELLDCWSSQSEIS